MSSGHAPLVVSVPDEEYAAQLADLDGVDTLVWDMREPHPRVAELDLVVRPYLHPVDLAARLQGADSLKVVQIQSAGYEDVLPQVPAGVTLCNAAGVHDASTAELAVGLAIAALRGIPEFVRHQDEHVWQDWSYRRSLADSRVVLLGYGQIGRAIASRLRPFEVSLTAVASRPRPGDDLVDWVHGIEELPDLVGQADVLIIIVPLTPTTRGLVNADLLARMPDGALVVNVARGGIVDTDALVAACETGRLQAALDVTDPEPLPADHPLWATPGVLITPHVGGATRAMRPRSIALVRHQIEALRDGRPLANVVS
ncbi:hydroxyacid dehydrogenase [Intrasporangium chromatireducens Q5-1]|uniref:Hydroxyacid dehydrogenase n=1 Tax=Intrasporangium chromatireducens Q5-1 TaxID=584657 RepID=W9GFW0_9MICO|nr:2-hydroxyacid dehydrogenase [Intrasporangium chromatireducens]EWT05101.1 hydroxyacid dehydrogenase [Intrasporangium chromatireducens Q5-1]